MNEDCCIAGRPANLSEEAQAMGRTIRSLQEPCGEVEDCEREVDCDEPCCCKEEDSSPGKIRDVKINQVNYGYIVNIGCHTFAFETAERLIEKLGLYLKEPNKTERSWYQGTLL